MLLPGLAAMNGFCGAIVAGIGCVAAAATDVPAASAQSASAAERRMIWAGDIGLLSGFIRCAEWCFRGPFAALVCIRHRAGTCTSAYSRPVSGPAVVAIAGVLAAAFTAILVGRSDILVDPQLSAWVRAGFVLANVAGGAYTWWRRPASGFGPLFALTGLMFALTTLNALAAPLAFTLGRIAYAVVMLALVYVCLCFPRGALGSRRDRVFVGVLGALE